VTSSDLSTVGLQKYVRDVTSNDLSTVLPPGTRQGCDLKLSINDFGLEKLVRDVTSNDLSTVRPSGKVREFSRSVQYCTRKPQGVVTPQLLVPRLGR
jgi:hypothetical protein